MTESVQTQLQSLSLQGSDPTPGVGSRLPVVPRKWTLDAPLHQDFALAYCEGIAFGRTLGAIETDPGMPPKDLFLLWVMKHPEITLAFTRARELSAYSLEDDALHLLRSRLEKPGTATELRAADLLVQQIRWSAGKRNPQVFSEKAAVNVSVPIQINTSLDMGGGGLATSTKEFPNIYELKADLVQEIERPEPSGEGRAIEAPPDTYAGVRDVRAAPVPKGKGDRRFGSQKRVLVPRVALTLAEREAQVAARVKLAAQKAANLEARKARRKERRRGSDTQD